MKKLFFVLIMMMFEVASLLAKTVHTIGDSTMADYDQSQPKQTGMYGWGSYLGAYLNIPVKNWGERGTSTISFYKKKWPNVKANIKKGDYVIIQFGHNDMKSMTTDEYESYLDKYIQEIRALGATPILATSICRLLFDGNMVSRLGRIDNGKVKGVGKDDRTFDFPYHMRITANRDHCALIDMTAATEKVLESWGEKGSEKFFPFKRRTHTNELGARINAMLAAHLLVSNKILDKKDVRISEIKIPYKINTIIQNKINSNNANHDMYNCCDGPSIVILTAGQSNTDGRVMNTELPIEIQQDKYKYCLWSFGSGAESGMGKFETFWPRIINKKNPWRWGYDAIVYNDLERDLKQPFYVIKESMGGTAVDTLCTSNSHMYWSADPEFLKMTVASDQGGKSLLKAFTENIGACIDNQLTLLPNGYDVKMLIWHQGESDRHQAKRYFSNMKAVIEYVRDYLVIKTGKKKYAKLPVILGGISHKSKQYSSIVEAAKQQLAKEDQYIYYVAVPNASLRQDAIHFDSMGAQELGNKIYQVIKENKLLK